MKKWLISIVMLLFLSSCSFFRKAGEDYCVESKLNTEAIQSTSRCILKAWPTRYGVIMATLGPRVEELPKQAIDAMEELNTFAMTDPNELTDYQLGTTLGLRIRLLITTIEEILKEYAPEALRYLP